MGEQRLSSRNLRYRRARRHRRQHRLALAPAALSHAAAADSFADFGARAHRKHASNTRARRLLRRVRKDRVAWREVVAASERWWWSLLQEEACSLVLSACFVSQSGVSERRTKYLLPVLPSFIQRRKCARTAGPSAAAPRELAFKRGPPARRCSDRKLRCRSDRRSAGVLGA